jgi:hypothetical protein
MVEIQGYNVGKEGGAFWFEIDLVATTLVLDIGFSSWSCALQPKEN